MPRPHKRGAVLSFRVSVPCVSSRGFGQSIQLSECGQWVLARRFLFVLNVWVSCGKEIDTEARSAGIAFWAV